MGISGDITGFLDAIAMRVRDACVFGEVRREGARVACAAKESAAPAEYRVDVDDGRCFVSLVTADRWLNGSIETDLVHTGDKIDELFEEELVELGCDVKPPASKHYRSDDKLFTFRTLVPITGIGVKEIETASAFVLGYEACFRRLGDMQGGSDE
jgi:hypothetical protein